MKLSRPSINRLIWVEQWPPWQTLLVGVVLFIFAMTDLQLMRAVERTIYQCDRPNQDQPATCSRTKKAYLGLITLHYERFQGVSQAQAKREVKAGEDYRYELHSVTVTTQEGDATFVEPPMMRAGRRGDPEEMAAIASQLNTFLRSQQSQWNLQTWESGIWVTALMALYLTVFIIGAIIITARQMGPVTYSLERQSAIAQPSKTFLFTRQDRWGQREVAFGWQDILEFKVTRSVVGGKHRRVVYTPLIKLRHQQQSLFLNSGGKQLQAEGMLREVKSFLRQPSLGQPSSMPTAATATPISADLQSLERELYQGRQGRYYTTGTPAIPTSETPKVLKIATELRRLGGQYLGDLQCSKFAGMTAYVYSVPQIRGYALIYQYDWPAAIDYYSRLSDGSSLTTTSRFVAFIGWGRLKPHFRSHVGFDTQQLYHRHQQHLKTFACQRLLQAQPLVPSLTAFAQEMDRHLSDRSGILLSI
ncbi:MAG: hypothetical protein AAFY20_13870 [Cyanobacteria bacterium J06639_14]